jgi:iron complex outermembrane receptor protein
MKIKFLLLSLLLGPMALAQNAGTVKGTIKTSDGEPASFVTITLKGTNKGASTDNAGAFRIRNVAAGQYILVATYIGFETKEHAIEVRAGETVTVPEIFLSESAHQLHEITINESRTNPFDRKQSEFVAKLPLTNIENPQVYSIISAELLKDQVVTNFDDALKNAPGVEKLWESTGRGGDGAGYFSLRGFKVQPTMVNGLPGLTNGSLDPA